MISKITCFFITSITLMSATCGSNAANTTTTPPGNPCQGNNQPFGSGVTCQCEEIAYGNDPNQKYDIYIPTQNATGSPRPLVIYIHGGGFIGQDKRGFINPANPNLQVKKFLQAGYAVASINYRFITANETVGIKKCIQDCKDAIAHIQNLPSSYGLAPNRIALWGSSAGAGIAMLIGFNADPATNPVKAMWVEMPQATYDIVKWHSSTGVFPSCNQSSIINLLSAPYIKSIYGLGTGPINFGNLQTYRDEVDILQYIDEVNDPPIWIENTKPANNGNVLCPGNKALLNHHKNHCLVLQDKLEDENVEWYLRIRNLTNTNNVITRSAGAGNWNSGVEFVINKLL